MEDENSHLKVVQIDDSGIGSPVGGAAIGAFDVETGIFKHKFVDVEYFQDGLYKHKEYQNRVVDIVQELFEEMGITKETHMVEICSGHIFDNVRLWLDDNEYAWMSVKIEDPLQFMIEDAFSDYLVSIGVPEKIRQIEVGRDQFMYLFNWVKNDPDARVKYCKTNGQKWKTKWSHRLYEKPRARV
ncbi:hypothetical protein [Methanooceanicella nereidis]|uniref:hypothetical protein n=1 Tax=Methanooceanicella nereidis TaxID=2052831 RepID=UPI001E2B20B2|nr:hypothetical protein [Methanocella sp. CWC-04]